MEKYNRIIESMIFFSKRWIAFIVLSYITNYLFGFPVSFLGSSPTPETMRFFGIYGLLIGHMLVTTYETEKERFNKNI